jgi:predicted transcriptional regulator
MPKNKENLLLLHPTRWSIYKIICENPGTYFYKLMSEIANYSDKASSATIIYHLKKLNDEKLLKTEKVDGKRIYYPTGLRESKIERVFMLLQNENARLIFQYIINNDRPFQNELARELKVHHDTINYHTSHLEDAGLITKEKEGKFTRFKIAELGQELINGSLNVITEEYVNYIFEKLSSSCHFPEIIEKTQETLKIRVVCPEEDDIELTISLNDFQISLISEIL